MPVLTVTRVDQHVRLTHTCVKVNFSVWVKRVPFVRTSPPADAPPNDCSNSARSEVERWAPWKSGRGWAAARSCSSIRRCRRDRFRERYSYRRKETAHQRENIKGCLTHCIERDWAWSNLKSSKPSCRQAHLRRFVNLVKLPALRPRPFQMCPKPSGFPCRLCLSVHILWRERDTFGMLPKHTLTKRHE